MGVMDTARFNTAGLTRHAQVRMQQRGIDATVLDDLLAYGRAVHDHHGAEIVFFDYAARRRLGKRLAAYAVIGPDGEVRTVGHRFRRIRRQ